MEISLSGIEKYPGHSTRKVILVKNSKIDVWVRSIKDISDCQQTKQQILCSLLQATRLLLDINSLHETMHRPLKQGKSILKLLDQTIWVLEGIRRHTVRFDHKQFFHELFCFEDQVEVGGDNSDAESVVGRDQSLRDWNLEATIGLMKLCKRKIILEQICFMVDRIQMKSFAIEIKPDIQMISQMLIPQRTQRKKLTAKVIHQPSRFSISKNQLILPTKRSRGMGSVYSFLKVRESVKNINLLSQGDGHNRIFYNDSYHILWNSKTQEYQNLFRLPATSQSRDNTCIFIDQLNAKLKTTKEAKQYTSLQVSLYQNKINCASLICVIFTGLLLILYSESNLIVTIFLALIFAAIFAIYTKITIQQIYSMNDFRDEIKKQLHKQFEKGRSKFSFQLEQEGFDIKVISKQQYDEESEAG